ncbi:40S ribosomal protein S4 [Striga asiatica]|uniref:40S ribosomal protein S4 n=1 Tax=Striga asiatica TaxID=4170 RepID=A0A5A7NXB0_STRAF|nr:40S ribosomal protein S4 [Striga asiatica]
MDSLSLPPNLLFAKPRQNPLYNPSPTPHPLVLYKNRVALRISRQEPPVLPVGRPIPEENRHRTGQHTIENRAPGITVPFGLQAELRPEQSFQNNRRVGSTLGRVAVHQPTETRFGFAVPEQKGPKIAPDPVSGRPNEGEQVRSITLAHEFLPQLDGFPIVGVESRGVRRTDVAWVPRGTFYNESGHGLHLGRVEETGAPAFGRFGQATEIPRLPALDPVEHLLAKVVPPPRVRRRGCRTPQLIPARGSCICGSKRGGEKLAPARTGSCGTTIRLNSPAGGGGARRRGRRSRDWEPGRTASSRGLSRCSCVATDVHLAGGAFVPVGDGGVQARRRKAHKVKDEKLGGKEKDKERETRVGRKLGVEKFQRFV